MTPARAREHEQLVQLRQGTLPHITLKWAQSVDGQLADDADCSQWISGTEERRYTHWLRSVHSAVMVGAQTFLKDRCQLTVRSIPFAGKQPARVVADPRGRIAEVIHTQADYFVDDSSLAMRLTYVLVKQLPDFNPHPEHLVFVECDLEGSLDHWLVAAIEKLAVEFQEKERRPLESLMVEGGSGILSALLRAGVATTIEAAISPLLLGGAKHRIAPDLRMADNRRLISLAPLTLGQDILLRFQLPQVSSSISFQLGAQHAG